MVRASTPKYQNNVRRIARFLSETPDQLFTVSEIAKALDTTAPRVSVAVKTLQRYGLVIEHAPAVKGNGKRYQGKAGAVLWGAG